ncbi:glutamate synthase central domain-containing protein, partial [Micropruina sp.]|uniref:glutamate synthase central domain-containing protein n=1 Tax=Micropruina sp. TaxID=2737536 RepID=UPI0026333763
MGEREYGLYQAATEHSACGVGFITRKDGAQTHDVIALGEQALCAIPHRGGMSAEGVGDGAGVSIDLSVDYFSALAGRPLERGHFGVGNFFMPDDPTQWDRARGLIDTALAEAGLATLVVREVPVDDAVLRARALRYQLPIVQWVFQLAEPGDADDQRGRIDRAANAALLAIEAEAYTDPALTGLYPLSLSARTQVLKGRLNAGEVIGYFTDLRDPAQKVRSLYFHTRFSTNTEPHPTMAQPFRLMAHNGELNTDRKNRISDETLAITRHRRIVRPPGQSDSGRLDQTLQSRVFDDGLDLVEAVVSLMPPAWENDATLSRDVRDMFEFFSLYEEKNDGPAALIFSDGDVIGARLDRLGLRPLRTVETDHYLVVSSEAGQVDFPDDQVIHRGRIEAGGMLYHDHRLGRTFRTREALELLAARRDYAALLDDARVDVAALPAPDFDRSTTTLGYTGDLSLAGRYVAYSLNQESFRFMMDPMLADGAERISAMGYGNAINALSDQEGGMAKYFSQRFAQVTNPPLDSLREADGMSMRVALGAKPDGGEQHRKQLVVGSPILGHLDMVQLREQRLTPLRRFDLLFEPHPDDAARNAASVVASLDELCDTVAAFARDEGGIAVLTDREISTTQAPLPLLLAIAAVNQRLIDDGLRLRVSLVAESGQLPSSHHIAAALGFGASAVYSLSARLRAEEKYPSPPAPAGQETETDRAFARFRKAAEKSLGKTMGRVGLCTVESYIGGEFFEPNYLDTSDEVLARCFPHMAAPVGGVGFSRIA